MSTLEYLTKGVISFFPFLAFLAGYAAHWENASWPQLLFLSGAWLWISILGRRRGR